MEYILIMTNIGNTRVTFKVTVEWDRWEANLRVASYELDEGAKARVTVSWQYRRGAVEGETDNVTVTVTFLE